MYIHLFTGSIPTTRLISYSQFKATSRAQIKEYILYLLKNYPSGLDTRQISDISGIWVQSLTNPLQTLSNEGLIEVNGIHRSTVSKRMVQVYSIPKVK